MAAVRRRAASVAQALKAVERTSTAAQSGGTAGAVLRSLRAERADLISRHGEARYTVERAATRAAEARRAVELAEQRTKQLRRELEQQG